MDDSNVWDFENTEWFNSFKSKDRFVQIKITKPDATVLFILIPIDLGALSFKLITEEYINCSIGEYENENYNKWKKEILTSWKGKESQQTFKVLSNLLVQKWVCRSCSQSNSQSAARVASLRRAGYVIATKYMSCTSISCKKRKTVHDYLIPFGQSIINSYIHNQYVQKSSFRKPISDKLKERIYKMFNSKDAYSGLSLTPAQRVIDHKFPEIRWTLPESDNSDSMSDDEIKSKFQLLSHQTNSLKSRVCENCKMNNIRGDFMGIVWYYQGDKFWITNTGDETGCYGCPLYDLLKWKEELKAKLT